MEGPPIVWAGEAGAPTVLVLDPGEAAQADVPPTWQDVVRRHRVGWCRTPVEGALSMAEDLLTDPDGLGTPIDLVTSGPAFDDTLGLAARHPETVRSVLVVDPPSRDGHADTRSGKLAGRGVPVTLLDPSRPLGHPDVATAVCRTLDES